MLDHALTDRFESRVLPQLYALLRQIRFYVLTEGLAYLSVAVLLCFLSQISIDYLFRLRVDLRAALLLAIMIVLGVILWRKIVTPLKLNLGITDAAGLLERKFPHLESRLISAVAFARGDAGAPEVSSPALMGRVIEQACEAAKDLPTDAVLDHGRVRKHGSVVCAVLALFVVLTLLAPEPMGTWFERNILLGNTAWKQNTYLIVLNDDDRDGIVYFPRGDDLVIRVTAQGKRPRQVRIDLRFASDRRETHTMTAVAQNEFRFTISRLNDELEFRVRGGDARNDAVNVKLVDRPKIVDATVTVYPPPYALEPPHQLHSGQPVIEVLAGSEVEIRFTANKPLSRAVLLRDQAEIGETAATGTAHVTRFKPDRDATLTFGLTDERGLGNVRPRQFLVRLLADAPPTVSLQAPGVSDLVTRQAVLPLKMSFKDRYGLAGGALVYHLDGESAGQGRIEIEEITPGGRQLTTTLSLRLSELGVKEDQQLLLFAQATDLNDITGPGVGSSSRYRLRIVSSEELLAEVGRREQEYRQEFERLIDMQERLRNDTLSAASVFLRGGSDKGRSINFAGLERRQRQVARQVAHLGTQFQRIFDELEINGLDSPEIHHRLVGGIVAPLNALADRQLADVADAIDQLGGAPNEALFNETDIQQERIVAEMRRILANMTKWEGFHLTISVLQGIIKMQRQLRDETDETLDRQLDDIFKKEQK